MVHYFRHTVLRALHHHTATEHTTEVSTLDSIHQTTGIDWQYAILFPVTSSRIGVNRTVRFKEVWDRRILKERIDVISCQG